MSAADDYYKSICGIRKFGQLFTQLVSSYGMLYEPHKLADPKRVPEPLPEYMKALLGHYVVPSMHMEFDIPNPPSSSAKLGKPTNVARVLSEAHMQLRGLFSNIHAEAPSLQAVIDDELAKPDTRSVVELHHRSIAESQVTGEVPMVSPDDPRYQRQREVATRGIDRLLDAGDPSKIPFIRFTVRDPETRENKTVTIPNKKILLPETHSFRNRTYFSERGGIPLAVIAWALDRITHGKKGLQTAPEGLYLQAIVGVQESLTQNMAALLSELNKALPENESITKYLRMDGKQLTQTAREEAHAMQIWNMVSAVQRLPSQCIYDFLQYAGVDALDMKPAADTFSRDVACLLYATAKGMELTLNEERVNNSQVETHLERALYQHIQESVSFTHAITGLKQLADNVYRCKTVPEAQTCLAQPVSAALLREALYCADMLDTILLTKKQPPTVSLGLQLLTGGQVPKVTSATSHASKTGGEPGKVRIPPKNPNIGLTP